MTWDKHYLKLALLTAENKSKDPRTKVGAVITSPDYRHVSVSYNGFPVGVKETAEKWTPEYKHRYVIHAELNCIINCPFDTKGCILYCTHKPCPECLKAIINSRIDKLVYISRPEWEGKYTSGVGEELLTHVTEVITYTEEELDND